MHDFFCVCVIAKIFNLSVIFFWQQWEVLVLAKLAWDICPITTHDFVDPLIHLLPDIADAETVRNHALTFLALGHGGKFTLKVTSFVNICSI